MPNNQANLNIGVKYNVDQSSVNAVRKSLQDLQNIKIQNFSGTEQLLQDIKRTASLVLKALTNAFNPKLNTVNLQLFSSILQSTGKNLNSVYTDFSKLGTAGKKAFSDVASQVMTTNNQLTLTKTLLNTMGLTMMNTVKWGIASSVMNNFTNSVQQAFQYVQSLDSALTDIRIVTGDSREEMAKFAQEANNAAQSLGRSTMDYTKAALSFYQQGLNDEDVQARTEAVLKAQNITGAGDEMADYLTAVWNGYKVANEEAELYVDKLASVADSSASNMSLLAIAMSKVASTANAMGVDIDQLNAQIATIVATTRQAPESVGNALKTIYSRINDISTGAEDALISLGNYSSKMLDVGISVLDANGNLRDTGEVIELIGGKWSDLSREQQIYLARTMAGQRQYNNLIALFDNWSKYSDLVNISMLSQGTLVEKNARYMDSLGARMLQLGAAGERVKDALINEDDLKGLVSFGTNIVNLFGDLILGIGGSRGAILNFGSIFTQIFSNVIGKEIGNTINKMTEMQNSARAMAEAINNTTKMQDTLAYKDPDNTAFKNYVDNLKEIHTSWQVLSKDQILEQQQRAKSIESLSQLRALLIKNQDAANEFVKAMMGGSDKANIDNNFLGAQTRLKNLRADILGLTPFIEELNENGTVNIEQLKLKIDSLYSAMGRLPDKSLLKLLRTDTNLSEVELDELINKLLQLQTQSSKTINFALNIDKAKSDLFLLDNKINVILKDFEKLNEQAKTVSASTRFVQSISAIGQLAGAVTTVVNLFKTWNDENVSLGQKISQTLTSAAFIIPSIISAVNRLRDATGINLALALRKLAIEKLTTLLKEKQALIEERQALIGTKTPDGAKRLALINKILFPLEKQIKGALEAVESFGSKGATAGTALSTTLGGAISKVSGLLSSQVSILGTFSVSVGALLGWIGGIAAAGYALYKIYNQAADAAKKAALIAKSAKEEYDQIKESSNNLNTSLNELHSALDKFKDLTKGTQEWRTALDEVNQKVLDLITKFPLLGEGITTTSDGLLQLSDLALQTVQNLYRNRTLAAGLSYASLNQNSVLALNFSNITNLSRLLDGLLGLTPKDLQEVVNAVNLHGSYILKDELTLSKFVSIGQKSILTVIDNSGKINSLASEVKANTTAALNLTKAYVQNFLSGNDKYENSNNQEAFARIVQNALQDAELSDLYIQGRNERGLAIYDRSKIAEAYSQNEGIEVRASLLGDGYLKFNEATGKWQKINKEIVESAVAYNDALNNADQYITKADNILKSMSEKQGNIFSLFINGLDNVDWSKLSEKDIEEALDDDFLIEQIADALKILPDKVREALGTYTEDIRNATTLYLQELPRSVKNSLSQITKGHLKELSLLAQQALGNLLSNSFSKGLLSFEATEDILKGLDAEDILPFDLLLKGLDTSSLNVDNFREYLKDADIQLEATDSQLELFIQWLKKVELEATPEQTYKSIHLIIDSLKTGDTITSLEADVLKSAGINLDTYFTHMADGTLKLVGDAKDFFEYANNQSLEGFKQQIESLKNLNQQINDFNNNSQYAYSTENDESANLETFSSFSSSAHVGHGQQDTLLLQEQLKFLLAIGVQDSAISQAEDDITNKRISSYDTLSQVASLVADHKNEWQDLNNVQALNTLQIRIYELLLANANGVASLITDNFKTLDADVDKDAWEDLTEYLYLYGDQILGVDLHVTLHKLAAEELAEEMLRYKEAVEEVTDKYDDWLKVLSETEGDLANPARIEAANELQNVYSDLLNLPFENLSHDFTTDINNLLLMKQAISGNELAYNQLMDLAQQDIITHANLDLSGFEGSALQLQNTINNVESNIGNLEIGASIDSQAALMGMNDIINAAADTKLKATDILATMGVDAEVELIKVPLSQRQAFIDAVPHVTTEMVDTFLVLPGGSYGVTKVPVPTIQYSPVQKEEKAEGEKMVSVFRVKSAHKSSGGNFKIKNTTVPSSGGSGGSRGGGGGGGSTAKPSIAKTNTSTVKRNKQEADHDPYEQIDKQIKRQTKLLDELEDKEKHLSGAERYKNLQLQNKELEEQADLLELRIRINKEDAGEKGTSAWYAERLKDTFGNNIFDKDGLTLKDENKLRERLVNMYNKRSAAAEKAFKDAQKDYNNWINNVWNKQSKEWQDAHKDLKEKKDAQIKAAELSSKNNLKSVEDWYKQNLDYIEDYKKALEEAAKDEEELQKIRETIVDNKIANFEMKIDLAVDTGDLERDWLEFEKKFVKKIRDDDIFGQALYNSKLFQSYFDSSLVQTRAKQIAELQALISKMEEGIAGGTYGGEGVENRLRLAQERLKELLADQMKDYLKLQELAEDMMDHYLDSLDDAKDKMDDQVDQYERVNDLIEHNVRLTLLIYGDKAYDTMDKYYDMQKSNNETILQNLRAEQLYWQNMLNNETVGSDAWKNIKKHLDDTTDDLNSKLEDMIENLSDQWENRIDGIIAKLNNALTGGRSLDYLDEQWDYINDFDDKFLDTVESHMGINEVTNLYQDAIDDLAGNPASQQKINKLMNDQLKILREKDKLTQYDIDRAKAALEVLKARMALEDARYNKTKMRLRRDSQGNYTYQYVADEEKLSDLQSALADAQANLYNMDKEHYKQNLNDMYDTYKDYINKMKDLTEELRQAQAAGDDEEAARVQSRIDLLKLSINATMSGLLEDNEVTLMSYLRQSFFDSLDIDSSQYSEVEQLNIMQENIPQMQSNIQDLANTIREQGGIISATADSMKAINEATKEYDDTVEHLLEKAGTSVETVMKVTDEYGNALDKNIQQAQTMTGYYTDLINKSVDAVDKVRLLLDLVLNGINNISQDNIDNLIAAYNAVQEGLNGVNKVIDDETGEKLVDAAAALITNNPDLVTAKLDTTTGNMSPEEYQEYLNKQIGTGSLNQVAESLEKISNLDINNLAEEDLNSVVDTMKNIVNYFGNATTQGLDSLMKEASSYIGTISNVEHLDQNVHIEAHFPNVVNHLEIEAAINNLVNIASQKASTYSG